MLTLKFRPVAFSEEKEVRFLSGRENLKSFRNGIKQMSAAKAVST